MVAIDTARWRAISPLLDELLDADSAQREARVSQLRSHDPVLAEQVAALLAQQAVVERERFLEGTVFQRICWLSIDGADSSASGMTSMKEATRRQRWFASAIHMLAVRQAELGLAEEAIRALQTALVIEPGLELTRFHLGMLLLEGNHRSEARKHFCALRDGSLDSALRNYSKAMIALGDGDHAVARRTLAMGLSRPSTNPGLAAGMRRLFEGFPQCRETLTNCDSPCSRLGSRAEHSARKYRYRWNTAPRMKNAPCTEHPPAHHRTVLIADHQVLVRDGIKMLIAEILVHVHFVEADNGDSLLQAAHSRPAIHLALIDPEMPGMQGALRLAELTRLHPAVPVVIVSALRSVDVARWVMSIPSVCAVVSKSAHRGEVRSAIEAAMQGRKLACVQLGRRSAQPESTLTPRQREIRDLLRQGFSNKMIAGALGISEGTVKNHITEIFRVLNATNRTQAAQFSAEAE